MSEKSQARRGGRALGVAVLLAVGGMVAAVVGTFGVSMLLRQAGVQFTPVLQLALFVPGFLMFVAVAAAYLWYRDLPLSYVGVRTPSIRDAVWVAGGYVGAFGAVVVSAAILSVVNVDPNATNSSAKFGMEHPDLLLWMIPLMLFVVAPAEEFLFRGVIQNRLRETFVPGVAILVTAAIFASLHFFALTGGTGGKLIAVGILFFPSLVFGVVYERTGNLVTNTIVHGVYNSTLVLLIYVSVKLGTVEQAGTSALAAVAALP